MNRHSIIPSSASSPTSPLEAVAGRTQNRPAARPAIPIAGELRQPAVGGPRRRLERAQYHVGKRFWRGIMFGAIASVPLWALIIAAVAAVVGE
jgi:hypothetical protein